MKKKGDERKNCWNVGRGKLRGNEREVWDGESERGATNEPNLDCSRNEGIGRGGGKLKLSKRVFMWSKWVLRREKERLRETKRKKADNRNLWNLTLHQLFNCEIVNYEAFSILCPAGSIDIIQIQHHSNTSLSSSFSITIRCSFLRFTAQISKLSRLARPHTQ